MLACERGCSDTVALLVDAGCDTGARNSHGRTGWELAKLCEHTQVTHLLELYAYGGKAKKGDREGNGDQARSEIGYDELLAQVGLEGKKQEMADSGLAKGVEVMQLQKWDESELKEKILESKELDLTDEQKTKFKAAVLALPYELMPHEDLEEEFRQLKAKPMETQRQEDGEISDMRLHVWHTVEGRPSFENFETLSSGAYGDIFKVNDVFPLLEVNGERVSTVVLKAVKRGAGAEAVTALGNETRALMELDNPYIVSVYGFSRTAVPPPDRPKLGHSARSGAGDAAQSDAKLKTAKGGSEKKQYVLLLQLCDCDLNEEIHKADSWRVKWRYALEMAKGLAYIHARGQAHLDIKPGNIFLRERQKKDDEAAAAAPAPTEPAASAATVKDQADTRPYQVHVGDFGMDSSKSIDEKKCEKMIVDELRWRLDKWLSELDGDREGLTKTLLDREKQKDTDRDTISEEPVAKVQRADDSDLPVCEKRHERRKEIESLRTFEQLKEHPIVKHLRGREKDQVDALVKKHQNTPAAAKGLTDQLREALLRCSEVKPKPIGTYDYMALEAYEGFPEPASDVFSYGVMLWELFTEQRVYEGFQRQDNEPWDGGVTYDHALLTYVNAGRFAPAEQIPDRFYRSNRRPTMYKWVPEPMKLLIEACWPQNPDARLRFPTIVRALELLDDQVDTWTTRTEFGAAKAAPDITYDEFLAHLGLMDKKEDLASYLSDPGAQLVELKQMDSESLDVDILEDSDLGFDEPTREKFREAVKQLEEYAKEDGKLAFRLATVKEKETAKEEITYDEFLANLNLTSKKEQLADYLADGKELKELKQMDADDLNEDILDEEALSLSPEEKDAFHAALKELEEYENDDRKMAFRLATAKEKGTGKEKETAKKRFDRLMAEMYGTRWMMDEKSRLSGEAKKAHSEVERLHILHQSWKSLNPKATPVDTLGSLLQEAAVFDHWTIVKKILAKCPRVSASGNASVDDSDSPLVDTIINVDREQTLLHVACAANSHKTVRFLLNEANPKPDPTKQDKHFANPHDLAKAAGMEGELLEEIEIAVKLHGCLLGRYRLDAGPPHHVSFTCSVIFADDLGPLRSREKPRRVALKFMSDPEQFRREIEMRLEKPEGQELDDLEARAEKAGACLEVNCKEEFQAQMLRSDYCLEVNCEEEFRAQMLCSDYVVGMLQLHILPNEDPKKEDPKKTFDVVDKRLQGRYLLVMGLAEYDLMDAISHGHFAGKEKQEDKKQKVRDVVRQIAASLLYFENKRRAHGDCKLRNLVQVRDKPDAVQKGKDQNEDGAKHQGGDVAQPEDEDGAQGQISLADFDASAAYDAPAGIKHSSGCLPPELLQKLCQYEIMLSMKDESGPAAVSVGRTPVADEPEGHKELEPGAKTGWETWITLPENQVPAATSLDVWSFGILLFRLCSDDAAPVVLIDEKDNIVEPADREAVAYRWTLLRESKTMQIKWDDARDLILWCLSAKPERRPKSFKDVLGHRFLDDTGELHNVDIMQHTKYVNRDKVAEERAMRFHKSIVFGPQKWPKDPTGSPSGEVPSGDDEVKTMLEDGSAPVDRAAKKDSQILPIHRAVRRGRVEVVELILEEVHEIARSVILDARTEFDYTALHWAAYFGAQSDDPQVRNHYKTIAETLIQAKADTSLLNSRGKTAWQVAQLVDSTEVLEVLKTEALRKAALTSSAATEGEKFQQRLRGGLSMDALSGFMGACVGGLPLTSLSQNNGLIKQAGWHDYRGGIVAGTLLLLTGIA
eukprot:COSAG06_NODE_2345_length_7034_cov_87.911608_1_plen_1754_part_10